MVAQAGIRSNQLLPELVRIYQGLRAIEEIVTSTSISGMKT